MKRPLTPDNEPSRLTSLRKLGILDTEAEDRFDRITRVAQSHFQVPIALVSLVDEHRQWFKSRQGLAATETPRNISFCGHAILGEQTFVVNDASGHPDFCDNPLVSGDPNIKFYAGAPLHGPDGARLGTLCIIDRQPRELSQEDLGILRDLANCVELELALTAVRQREYFLQEITDAMPGMVGYWDKDLICRFANPPYLEWFGKAPHTVVGSTMRSLLGEGLFALNEPYIRGALAGERQHFERTLTKADGTTGYTLAYYIPDKRNGGVAGFFVLITDVTLIKEAERRVQKAEKHLQAILDNVEDGIVTVDQSGMITSLNHALASIFQYPNNELVGQNIQLAIPELNTVSEGDAPLGKVRVKPAGFRRELTGRTKKGMSFPVEVSVSEMVADDRTLFIAVVRDNTERFRAMQDLEKARADADAANKAKDRFLATISHEIRTPVTAVIGMTDLLLSSGLSSEQRDWAHKLAKSANTLLDLINDILDFSKIAAGRVELESVHFSLSQLVNETCQMFLGVASEKKNAIDVVINPSVVAAHCGDAKKYRQILMNLIGNANKFTSAGRISVAVSETRQRDGRSLIETRVSDTGIGISIADHSRLFEPFVQEDVSTSRRFGGTGLGLSISKRFVEMMGGNIDVESQSGKGSTFRFTVMLEPRDVTTIKDMVGAQVRPSNEGSKTAQSLRILVAEDNETISALINTILSRAGHSVTAVGDGAAAVGEAQRGTYDIILMDMQMPIMDGPDAMRAIRSNERPPTHIPIIAMTADALPENRQAYLAAGADVMMTKPIAWPDLAITMDALTKTTSEKAHLNLKA